MVKRTSLNLDFELVDRAKSVLGTTETTETVHRALHDVVKRALRERLAQRTFELTDEELERLRTPDTKGVEVPG